VSKLTLFVVIVMPITMETRRWPAWLRLLG
jgi:hypothetical protein